MKHLFTGMRLLTILIVLILINYDSYSKESITEGTSFWFGIPDVHKGLKELPRGSTTGASEELYITSKYNTNVRLYNGQMGIIKSLSVVANTLTIIGLPPGYQNTASEIVSKDRSFYLEAEEPISATILVNWYKSGETFHLIPTKYLGKEYFTLNLYLDQCKMIDDGTIEGGSPRGRDSVLHPPQILIIATEDNTEVNYYPSANTEKVALGNVGKVKLNRGESFLIQGDTSNSLMVQYEETDLSGTRILSTKNIAVFSGHTKGAFPKYPPRFFSSYSADFLRNMLFESILPVDKLGYEYVTIPIKYYGRKYDHKFPDDEGDLVRFVATEDSTKIYEMQNDGTWRQIVKSLAKGQYYDIPSRLTPGYFKSKNKILVGQYGKGWSYWSGGIVPKSNTGQDKEDELQGPPFSGEGMMMTVTPNERWSNYASLGSVPTVTSYFNIVFKTGDEYNINLDGTNLKTTFGGKIRKISGTPYSYLSESASVGLHYFEATDGKALFAVYAYGNTDAHKDGFAYGYPTGINYAEYCDDSLFITSSEPNKSIISGTITAVNLSENSKCAEIESIKIENSDVNIYNADFEYSLNSDNTSANFTIEFLNITKNGRMVISAMTKSGNKITKEFTYKPTQLVVDRSVVKYEISKIGIDFTKTIKISNLGLDTLTIDSLYLSGGEGSFKINSNLIANIVIHPGATKTYDIAARFNDDDIFYHSAQLMVSINNKRLPLVDLFSEYNAVNYSVGDDNWKKLKLYFTLPTTKSVNVKNVGNSDLKITSMKFIKNRPAFKIADNSELSSISTNTPYILDSEKILKFNIEFHPELSDRIEEYDELLIEFANNTSTTIPVAGTIVKAPLFAADSNVMKFSKLVVGKTYIMEREISNICNIDVLLSSINLKSYSDICEIKVLGLNDSSIVNSKSSKTLKIAVTLHGNPTNDISTTLYINYMDMYQELFKVLIPKTEVINSVEILENNSTLPKGLYLQNSKIVFENRETAITNIKLWDESGKLIKSYELNSNNFEISAEELATGVYLYQVQFGNQVLKGNFLIAPVK